MDTLSDAMVRKFKIPVEMSLTGNIVPDAEQILAPDEISVSFSSSRRINIGQPNETTITHLEGSVLVFRSPCKLPTDIRKLKAVYRPQLAYLKDCVVMSANSALCTRGPGSFLAGGDYDGDTVHVYWDPLLVNSFCNADESFAEIPPGFVEENFEREVVKVCEHEEALEEVGADEEMVIANQQMFLLSACEGENLTGTCKSNSVAPISTC